MINVSNQLIFTEEKNGINKFIIAVLKESRYWKGVIKKYFKKNLVMTVDDEKKV